MPIEQRTDDSDRGEQQRELGIGHGSKGQAESLLQPEFIRGQIIVGQVVAIDRRLIGAHSCGRWTLDERQVERQESRGFGYQKWRGLYRQQKAIHQRNREGRLGGQ